MTTAHRSPAPLPVNVLRQGPQTDLFVRRRGAASSSLVPPMGTLVRMLRHTSIGMAFIPCMLELPRSRGQPRSKMCPPPCGLLIGSPVVATLIGFKERPSQARRKSRQRSYTPRPGATVRFLYEPRGDTLLSRGSRRCVLEEWNSMFDACC